MEKIVRAKHIIAIAKSLKRYSGSDVHIASFLYASYRAGRSGLLASALRSQSLGYSNAAQLAAIEGFSRPEFKDQVIPWLERSGLCQIKRLGGEVDSLLSIVLSYDNILEAVADLHEQLEPASEDLACIALLNKCSKLPITESEAMQALAAEFGESKAGIAITLAKSYRVVDYREGFGLKEPLLYSAKVWADCITTAGKYISSMNATDRAVLLELVDQVRKYQGMPLSYLQDFAQQQNATHLLNMAIRLRLIHETRLQMSGNQSRSFLTTAHFYEEIAAEHGEDVCDRVKIFLDSIRNGQHFGDAGTGRILDPVVLISKLLDRGTIGPCTAIGTDYFTSEKAGIVSVRQVSPNSSRCYLDLVQKDTVEKVHEVLTSGYVENRPVMTEAHVQKGGQFQSIEQCAPELAHQPVAVEEAERAIILQLREG